MDKRNDLSSDSLFDAYTRETPAELACALAPPAAAGHFDELRGAASAQPDHATKNIASSEALANEWGQFFTHLGHDGFHDLNRRTANLQRQIRDNGVTYNVYADADGPQRPWSLDLFPLILSPPSWQQIEAGVLQRMRVLERVMADVYGPRQLLARGLLPPALVQGHLGYLRAMHGVEPAGGTHLHIAAFDLARGPDGHWWVVSQRTQAPSGLGYLLENRICISRLFPQAFESMHVQRVAATYRALIDGLKQMSPTGQDSHLALLTPGPYNETYFEHAYLARYLGLTLVEGSDLTVRDQRLYLKTLQGLEPVHGLLKRLDDQYLDPLELRPDSTLGVPGLLQAIRAGHVLVANAPGSAFLESTALLGFLPALSQHLLGEELQLPALPTWWCGERAALQEMLPQLGERVIKPTYPGSASHGSFNAVLGRSLSRRELDQWAGRIARQGDEHTVQAYLPLSQMPTWSQERIVPRSVMLRVFAVCDGPRSWRVLPGGMARIASADAEIVSMQRGGSSADAWVLMQERSEVDRSTLLQPPHSPATLAHRSRLVTSRAAENLFWLGRYTERAENTIRLARLTLECLNGEDQSSLPLLTWLDQMASSNSLVLPGVPAATQARRVFERSLIADLGNTEQATSVGFNLRAIKTAASAIRERLSQEHWNVIVRAEAEFIQRCAEGAADGDYSSVEALRVLEAASGHMAAMTGAQTDRMTRDDGWRLLSIGRHMERLGFLAAALARGFDTGSMHDAGGFEAMLALFDSTITFHAQYQQSREMAALLDLLVLDRDNPRSLGWVAQTLQGRMTKLAAHVPGALSDLAQRVPDPGAWDLAQMCEADQQGRHSRLIALLQQCTTAAYSLSDDISALYFTHSFEPEQSVGA
ncbi:MAG: circularly permuted type 2 ATP-grasp protein [Burkholderiaceae bacterium]